MGCGHLPESGRTFDFDNLVIDRPEGNKTQTKTTFTQKTKHNSFCIGNDTCRDHDIFLFFHLITQNMKKVFSTMIAIVAISFVAKADPAKKVNLAYENDNLKIEAIHKVKDVTTHYIDLITIKANGKEIKTIKPQKQTSTQSEVVEVSLPDLAKGTKIEVTTRCNEFGKKSATLVL